MSCINNVGVIATPELHASGGSLRGCGAASEVVHLQWRRPPAIVMQGWRPRMAKPGRSSFARIGAALVAFADRLAGWQKRHRTRHLLSLAFWRADD